MGSQSSYYSASASDRHLPGELNFELNSGANFNIDDLTGADFDISSFSAFLSPSIRNMSRRRRTVNVGDDFSVNT